MSKSIARAAAERALSQQGQHEIGTSNWGPQVRKYIEAAGLNTPVPWCECFVEWAYEPWIRELGGYGSVRRLWEAHPAWQLAAPRPYCLVAYDFGAATRPYDHVEVVLSCRKLGPLYRLETIGGNTRGASGAARYDGGSVERNVRWCRPSTVRFLGVPGACPSKNKPRPPRPPRWYSEALKAEPLWAWVAWRDNGAPRELRPPQVPRRIPLKWWARYRRHKGAR